MDRQEKTIQKLLDLEKRLQDGGFLSEEEIENLEVHTIILHPSFLPNLYQFVKNK